MSSRLKKVNVVVSVITTTYNSLEFLPASIVSIQKQSYQEYEHIIVDDGSTDGTPLFLDTIIDERIKVVKLARSGRAHALNVGMAKASGKYIAILDADDLSFPDRLKIQAKFLDDNQDCDLLGSGYSIDADAIVGEFSKQHIDELKAKDFIYRNPICHSSVMMRKESVKTDQIYNESRNELFDYDLWVSLLMEGSVKIFHINFPLVFKRIHKRQSFESRNRLNYLYKAYLLKRKLLKSMGGPFSLYVVIVMILLYGLTPRFLREKLMGKRLFSIK